MGAGVKWLGHAGFRLTSGDKVVYVDPYKLKAGGAKATAVLVTHDHFDHCSEEDVGQVAGPETVILGPKSCRGKLEGLGGRFVPVSPGGSYDAGGIRVRTVPAYNLTSSFHPREAGGVGYVIELGGEKIYHAGDTDFIPEMEDLAPDVQIDTALLPVGGTYTMTAEQAAEAFRTLGAKRGVPMHYGEIVGTKADADRFLKLIGG